MSRVEKFGSRKNKSQEVMAVEETAAAAEWFSEDSPRELPSRRAKHPSNKFQMTQWFYRLLVVLFLTLLIGLLIWGRKYYNS